MKVKNDIIVSNISTDINALDKKRANLGCDICPDCGETREFQSIDGKFVGLHTGQVDTEYVGMQLFKHGRIIVPSHYVSRTVWSCATCGATWLSRPYTVSPRRKDHFYMNG